MLVLDLVQNVALLIALAVAYRMLLARYRQTSSVLRKASFNVLNGLLFGLAGIVGMMTPVQVGPGIIFDGRSVVLGVAGLFGGPLPALVAGLLCAGYRLLLGGAGAWVGVAVIAESAALGAVFRALRIRRGWRYGAERYWGIGLLIHVVMLALMLALPGEAGWMVIRRIGLPVLLLYPLATMLVCQLFRDYERQERDHASLRKIAWMLEKEDLSAAPAPHVPAYGDVTALNTERTIRDGVGRDLLETMAADVMALLDTSLVVYEKSGDYAYGLFVSDWCALLDEASRRLCSTEDNREALACGRWLCHENCWNESARAAMRTGAPTDIGCVGGVRLYAVPIRAGDEIVGVINIGYGNPPTDEASLARLAERYGLEVGVLREAAHRFKPRPSFVIDAAKSRLRAIATTIGEIVERKRMETSLRRSETAFRSYIENAPEGIFITDTKGRYVDVNEAACAMTGYPREELLRMTVRDLDSPEATPEAIGAFDRLKEKGEVRATLLLRRKDGSDIHVSLKAVALEGGRYMGFCSDITERIRAEEALRRSEARFRGIFESAMAGVALHEIVYDSSGRAVDYRILDVNPAFERILGISRKRAAGALATDLYGTAEAPYLAEYEEVARSRRSKRFDADFEPMGKTFTVSAFALPDHRFATIFEDVTEQKQMQERLRQMEKMDAIGQLAGGVAHDFNNQLAGIMGYADMLRARLDDPTLQRFADNVLVAARRAGDLTQKLLAFARKGQYESVPVDLHDILHEVVDILRHSIDKRIEIRQHLTASPSTTRGDPGQIQNAVLNLALNASDAMTDGGELIFETGLAELDAAYCAGLPYGIAPGTYLRLCVTDTGCGIAPTIEDRIFEPFFTTKEVGKGTGMGLAAVYGTVKQHGGAINVYSEVGHGTTFRVYLPLEADAAKTVKRETDVIRAPRAATLLVVDDEKLVRDMAADMLRDLGYRVVVREHGEAAVAYYADHVGEIDLVLLDMVMPRLSGAETYRAMKAIRPDVKVLLASGYSINGAAQGLLAEGVRGFLQKPFERAELSARVAEALRPAAP